MEKCFLSLNIIGFLARRVRILTKRSLLMIGSCRVDLDLWKRKVFVGWVVGKNHNVHQQCWHDRGTLVADLHKSTFWRCRLKTFLSVGSWSAIGSLLQLLNWISCWFTPVGKNEALDCERDSPRLAIGCPYSEWTEWGFCCARVCFFGTIAVDRCIDNG